MGSVPQSFKHLCCGPIGFGVQLWTVRREPRHSLGQHIQDSCARFGLDLFAKNCHLRLGISEQEDAICSFEILDAVGLGLLWLAGLLTDFRQYSVSLGAQIVLLPDTLLEGSLDQPENLLAGFCRHVGAVGE